MFTKKETRKLSFLNFLLVRRIKTRKERQTGVKREFSPNFPSQFRNVTVVIVTGRTLRHALTQIVSQ